MAPLFRVVGRVKEGWYELVLIERRSTGTTSQSFTMKLKSGPELRLAEPRRQRAHPIARRDSSRDGARSADWPPPATRPRASHAMSAVAVGWPNPLQSVRKHEEAMHCLQHLSNLSN